MRVGGCQSSRCRSLAWLRKPCYGSDMRTIDKHMAPSLEQLRTELRAILPALQQRWPIVSLGVFGSYARGEQSPDSDLDLLIEFSEPIGFFRFLELEEEIGHRLGVKVELVTRAALKPHIGRQILAELVSV